MLISRPRATILTEVIPSSSSNAVEPSFPTTDPRLANHPPTEITPNEASTMAQNALAAFLSIPYKSRSSKGNSTPKGSSESGNSFEFANPYASRRDPEPKASTAKNKSFDPRDPAVFKATGHFAEVDDVLRRLVEYERHSKRTMESFYAEREQMVKERERMAEEAQRELEREKAEKEKEKVVGYDPSRDPRLIATDPRLR